MNNCKEIKYYIKNNELDLEKIINEYSSYTVTIIDNMARNIYWEKGKEKYRIYEGEWSYEIDVYSKMAQSNIVQYKLFSISDENYKFDSARGSNTAFKIYLSNCNGIAHNEALMSESKIRQLREKIEQDEADYGNDYQKINA